MLDLSNRDLLVVAQSVDTLDSTNELVLVVKASVLVDVPNQGVLQLRANPTLSFPLKVG